MLKFFSSIIHKINIKYRIIRQKVIDFFYSPFLNTNKEAGIAPIIIIAGLLVLAAVTEDDFFGLTEVLSDAGKDLFKAVILAICTLIVFIGSTLANLAVTLLNSTVQSDFLTKPITNQPLLREGWYQVRDFSNMFIVLGFIIIGIATILRIREYEAKKLLLPLITIALLINFSNVFVGAIIDGSNLLTMHFLKGGGEVGLQIKKSFDDSFRLPPEKGGIDWKKLKEEEEPVKFISFTAMFAAAYILIAVVFFYLTFMLIARQVLFSIFFILAPLAFLCWIFPQTKKVWLMWWENFIKWSLIGAQISFFLWLAGKMVAPQSLGQAVTSSDTTSAVSFLSIIILLYLSVKVSKISSAVGAGAVMAVGGGMLGLALGAGKALGGKVLSSTLSSTGVSRGWEKIKNAAGRTGERLGFVEKGTTAQRAQKEISEAQSRIATLSMDQQAKLAKQPAWSQRSVTDKVAAIKNLTKEGALDKIGGINEQNKALAFVESYEKSRGLLSTIRKEASKFNPNLAGPPEKIAETVQKMSPREFARNVHESAYTPEVLTAMSEEQIKAVFGPSGSPKKATALQELATSQAMDQKLQELRQADQVEYNALEQKIKLIKSGGVHSQSNPTS